MTDHYDSNQMLRLAIALTPPHPDEERAFLQDLSNKKSPNFRKFLSSDEFDARFAPSEADEAAVVAWAKSQGMTITHRYSNRLLVDVEAPAGVIETALNVKINRYRLNERSVFANDRDPVLPAHLAHVVQSVLGLNSIGQAKPGLHGVPVPAAADYVPGPAIKLGVAAHGAGDASRLPAEFKLSADAVSEARPATAKQIARAQSVAPQITNGNYDPTDLYSSQAYDFTALYNQGHCCNPLNNSGQSPVDTSIAIATVGNLTMSDIAAFKTQYPYLAYNVQPISVDGSYTCAGEDGNCLETTLDTEWSLAMANSMGSVANTAKVYVYQGSSASISTLTDVYNQILSDGKARVMSTSFGCVELDCWDSASMSADDAIFAKMVALGWTIVAATGDQGATAGCSYDLAVQFPASDPNVVAAGGTVLTLSAGPLYSSETAWSGGTSDGSCDENDGGGTGGYSAYFAEPSYQDEFNFPGRAVPDLSLNAGAPQNMYNAAFGGLIGVEGTSIVAPELAGFFAQVNAYSLAIPSICGNGSSSCAPLGNPNGEMWNAMGAGSRGGEEIVNPFYDITSGCNSNDVTLDYGLTPYCAVAGEDQATGIGSFNALQLAWDLNQTRTEQYASPTVTFSGPATGKWTNSNMTLTFSVSEGEVPNGIASSGIAGFTQGWDTIPSNPIIEAHPGAGNSFYSGPEYPNKTVGCLQIGSVNCVYTTAQGCHTAYVNAWDNIGYSSAAGSGPDGVYTYGPLCYDTVAPTTTVALSGTKSGSNYTSSVKVTLTAADSGSGGSKPTGSGVKTISYQLDSGTLTTYSAAFTVTATGSHTVKYYATDVAGNVGASQTVTFTIGTGTTAYTTKTVLAASSTTTTYGATDTLTATVTASGGATPTGTVTFKNGTTTIGSVALSSGKASIALPTTVVGSVSLTAVYAGDATDLTSTSAAITVTVGKAATSTTVTSTKNPSTVGASVSFLATVKSSTTGTPTGTVVFKSGSITSPALTINGAGQAAFSTTSLPKGSDAVTVTYSGSADSSASTSPVLTQTVN